MDAVETALAALKAERSKLDNAIAAIEAMDSPKKLHWTQTPEGRKRLSKAGKKRWAKESK